MTLDDAHNHLHFAELAAHRERILAAWPHAAGPTGLMVVNGTHPDDWPAVSALAAAVPAIRPAYGLHPWDAAAPRPADWLDRLSAQLGADPLATVGEIGLDRWLVEAPPDDPRLAGSPRPDLDTQIAVFLPQLDLATRHQRTASIHCVRAHSALLALLRSRPLPSQGFLLHAYAGPAALVPAFAELGAYFSFNTAFLDPRKTRPREAFRLVPTDRLLVETDAPAAPPPHAWRTHRLPGSFHGTPLNHPGNIEAAATGLAALRGTDLSELAAALHRNFLRLFSPPPKP